MDQKPCFIKPFAHIYGILHVVVKINVEQTTGIFLRKPQVLIKNLQKEENV